MKKITYIITLFIATIIFTTNVYATSFSVNLIGEENFKDELTLYLEVNDLKDFNGVCKGLCGLVGKLNYDKEKIELTSINALNDFELTDGNSFVLYKSTGVLSGTNILKLQFKNKTLTNNETTTISISDITATNGDTDINTNDISKTIKFIKNTSNSSNSSTSNKTSNKNNNNKKPSTNKQEETTTKNNNNYLSSLSINKGNIKFDKNTLTYNIKVDYETISINISAITEDKNATLTGTGTHNLNIGKNTIKVTVTAEDKTERTYTINVTRAEKDVVIEKKKTNIMIYIIAGLIILTISVVIITIMKMKKTDEI